MRSGKGIVEQLVEELQYQVPLKDTTEVGDMVIMLREDEDGRVSMTYARVMGFVRDVAKRDEWWHVRFVFLEVPPLPHTIILQEPHFTGKEVFTMGGRQVFIKAVNFEAFGSEDKEISAKPLAAQEEFVQPEATGEVKAAKPTFTLIKK